MKLIQLSDDPDEMFDLSTDLLELRDMSTAKPDHARRLNLKLSQFVHRVEALRDDLAAESNLDLLAAAARVRSSLTWKHNAERVIDVCQKALESHRGSRHRLSGSAQSAE